MKPIVLLFACFCVSMSFYADAQKLPNIQKDSQWLPNDVKVDGKLNEWNNQLKAANRSTVVDYTIANSTDQLYLAIKCADVGTIAKIMAGGITFTVNTAGKKLGGGPSLTVPVTNSGYVRTADGGVRGNVPIMIDSSTIVAAIQNFKFIKVLNFTGVADTLQSIYNEYSIKTRLMYEGATLVCEIMIPNRLIGIANSAAPFAYQIKLNGVPMPNFPGVPLPPPGPPPGKESSPFYRYGPEIRSVTDMWGEYTLAKKP